MNVLVACEESQRVCIEFRKKGHNAFSCDLKNCSCGFPEWHIKANVLDIINYDWDLIIAHPPCTYLSKAGARWLFKNHHIDYDRLGLGIAAAMANQWG